MPSEAPANVPAARGGSSQPDGLVLHWFLPTRGDAASPGEIPAFGAADLGPNGREASVDYLSEVASAAEDAGFASLLTPTGIGCPDPWIISAAVAARTSSIGFIVAVRPTTASPTLIAQQARTFETAFPGRLALNIVTGGSPGEQAAYGDHSDHAGRYRRTSEALEVIGPLLEGKEVTFTGDTVDVREARLPGRADGEIPLYLGGASPAAEEIAAASIDRYLLWAEPLAAMQERIGRVKARADARGRALRYGVRVHVLARATAEEAWAEANRLVANYDPDVVRAVQKDLAAMDSVGQHRISTLSRSDNLIVDQNLWAGIGLVREGVGTALVGSYEEVAERLNAYRGIGVTDVILSGYPHREEAERVGAHVLPLLRENHRNLHTPELETTP